MLAGFNHLYPGAARIPAIVIGDFRFLVVKEGRAVRIKDDDRHFRIAFVSPVADANKAAAILLPLEFVVHYLIDYTKCVVEARYRWATTEVRPDGARLIVIEHADAYFIAFLVDQLAHAMTLIGLVSILAARLA